MSSEKQLPGVLGQFISAVDYPPSQEWADDDGEVQVYDSSAADRWTWERHQDVDELRYWRPCRWKDPRPVALEDSTGPDQDDPQPCSAHDTILVCLVKHGSHAPRAGQWFANGSSCETPQELLSDFDLHIDQLSEVRWLRIQIPTGEPETVTLNPSTSTIAISE